jgi:restriction system protein
MCWARLNGECTSDQSDPKERIMAQLPKFGDLLWPMVEVLRAQGGSGTNAEIDDAVVDRMKLTDAQLGVLHKGGPKSQVEYLLGWARTYLKKAGLATNSSRGVWALTEKGRKVSRSEVEAVREDVNRAARSKAPAKQDDPVASDEDDEGTGDDWKSELLETMLNLSPAAFERLVQRLLREVGVASLVVTGKPGDGGIDGYGRLYASLFSTKVYFQCKRWKSTVGPGEVRDFRGAMQGRGDRGLLITTGGFTRDAEREAERDGAPPVDLIGGDLLCDLLRKHRVGVVVEQVERVTVDQNFFSSI